MPSGYVWNIATMVANWAVVQVGFPMETSMIGVSMEKWARAVQVAQVRGYSTCQAIRLSISL
jgi:hypothetical protein